MKKFLCLVLIIFNLVILCGCSAKEAIASDKQEYIVSSIGFDGEKDKIKMTIEAIVVNTDDLNEDKESVLFGGVGKSVNEAYSEIISQITQPLSLGHNGIIVIGGSITGSQLEEILNFCRNENRLNIATMLISAENAQELLSGEAVSSVAVGYDIMSMIEVSEEKRGIIFKNRLYEVAALKEKPTNAFYLPFISVVDKNILSGLTVFEQNAPVKILKTEEIPIFCLVTDSLTKGEFIIDGQKMEIKYSSVIYNFSFNRKLNINVNIRLKTNGDKELIKSKIEQLLKGEDIFGIGNIISQKEPKLWDKIKNDYKKVYKNSEIKVNINE